MANLLQSSQTKSTCAPAYYTNYLQQLATCGQAAEKCAQFVGATPLQQQAFCSISQTAGAQQPTFQTGMGYIGCAAQSGSKIGATVNPYLSAATNASPLCAAKPLICQSRGLNLGQVAQCYMNPFIQNQVQNMSDIAQRNIQQNLSPQATAAIVGSGQFGSQRGAQALGQVAANAEQCLSANIGKMLTCGYGQALSAAGQKESALGQLAGTTEQAQAAQNQAQLQAAQTAACAQSRQAAAQQAAGLGMGTLGTQAAAQNLACINALATLGAQCQQIKQNAQCYDFTKLAKEASLMQGQAIPTSVKTTLCMSPLSALGAAGAAAKASGLTCYLSKKLGCVFKGASCTKCCGSAVNMCNYSMGCASGGLVKARSGGAIGCASTRNLGALPARRK